MSRNCQWWADSPHKGPVMQKVSLCHDIIMKRWHTCTSTDGITTLKQIARKLYAYLMGYIVCAICISLNTLRPRQNGRHFADDTLNRFFLNEIVRILIKISLKFVPKGPINNIPSLVQILAWRRSGDKPLSEPMMVTLSTHICVTRPQWVNDAVMGIFF